jgi:cell division transport system permease protein
VLPRLRFFLQQAMFGLWRSLGVTILSVVTIGIALGLLATFVVVLSNLKRVAGELGREVEISGYLERSTTASTAIARAKEVARWEHVASAEYTTSTTAMASFRTSLGRDAVILDGLPADVLPPSIEVRLEQRRWTTAEVRALADRLGRVRGIDDVRYGQDDVERVNALIGFLRIAALVVGAALCMSVVLLVSNTIRLTVYARRDEIEIMSLIGATDFFVRAPFLIEGAVQGLLGGLAALGGLVLMRQALVRGIELGLSYAYGPIELEFVPIELVGTLLLLGMLLGLVGSLLAVGKFVKV